jgi:hypothetical protein
MPVRALTCHDIDGLGRCFRDDAFTAGPTGLVIRQCRPFRLDDILEENGAPVRRNRAWRDQAGRLNQGFLANHGRPRSVLRFLGDANAVVRLATNSEPETLFRHSEQDLNHTHCLEGQNGAAFFHYEPRSVMIKINRAAGPRGGDPRPNARNSG